MGVEATGPAVAHGCCPGLNQALNAVTVVRYFRRSGKALRERLGLKKNLSEVNSSLCPCHTMPCRHLNGDADGLSNDAIDLA